MKTVFLSLAILLTTSIISNAQTLTIKISGIKSEKGEIRLAFFSCDKDFKTEKPKITKYFSKKDLKNGCLTVMLTDIPSGQYGIALLDDENKNGKMDYSFFVPSEGFGFSNYYHEGLSKPNFSSFCFDFNNRDNIASIKVRYM